VHSTPEVAWYLEVDHLNTPIAARDLTGKIIWRWEADAFGSTQPTEDPDGDTQTTPINLRYPGQYYDKESGLHYNHRRYYDPKLGRYMSPDPIGLAGGANLYGYAKSNPLSYIDPDGNSPVLAVALSAAAAFYLGMDQISSIHQAKWKFDQLQELQELKNAQLGACMNFPQGGGSGGGQQTERAINQCARGSVPAASNAGYSPVPGPLDKALELLKRTAK
jgi:RHS repeat-associated protein